MLHTRQYNKEDKMAKRSVYFIIFISLLLFVNESMSKKLEQPRQRMMKTAAGQPYLLMNANNVTSWVHPDGLFNWLIIQSWNGEFPRGSGVGTIYSEGIVFGGLVNDGKYSQTLRVTGDSYFVGMQAGAMHADGTIDAPSDPMSRAFGVRLDMPYSIQSNSSLWPDLTIDAATFFQKHQSSVTDTDKAQIAAQYFTDWLQWPASKGAPWYVDSIRIVRNDGAFDPNNSHHIPGIPGASKTIWFVCNDENPTVSQTFAGSPPTGMEEQMTIWAYASSTPLNNIIFKQVKLIYKGNPGVPSTSHIDSMYVVQWADPDEGDGGGDFAGSDSTLNLNYVYNAATTDPKYTAIGLPAPAVGFVFLNGVAHYTGNMADSAVINFQWRHGYAYWHMRPDPAHPGKMIPAPLTAAEYFASGTTIADPDQGAYSGTQQWYNLMRGDLPRPAYPDGSPFYASSVYASAHNIVTPFVLSGDPVKGTGWIDGSDLTAGDRRLVTVHGSFQMNLNDTAESVIALVDGMGTDNLSSVTALKSSVAYAKSFYDQTSVITNVKSEGTPRSFVLTQNYPNPFNPTTTINYMLASTSKVVIKIYNILGQEIRVLVNEVQNAGQQSVVWNATNNHGTTMASGVYFYRTEITPLSQKSSPFFEVKKMMLLK